MFKDTTILNELNRIVEQLQITGSHIIFRNKQYAITPDSVMASLVNILYSECYALKETYQSGLAVKPYSIGVNDEQFVKLLSKHNNSKDKVEQGWQVKSNYQNGYVEVVKNEDSRVVPIAALQDVPPGTAINAGQPTKVFFPKEDIHRQPAFYYVFSNTYMDLSQNITRVYWNISSKGAPVLVDAITKKLNHYNIPFLFKCLSHPSLYFRRDAAVLYIDDTMMHITSLLLPEIYESIKDYLEEDVPLFAYKYKNGVGIAESPNAQESFGMNRMGTLANVLMSIPQSNDKIKEIATAFQSKGINPSTPFLNKGSRILFN